VFGRDLPRWFSLHSTPVPVGDLVIATCAFVFEVAIEAEDKHFPILEKYRLSSRS